MTAHLNVPHDRALPARFTPPYHAPCRMGGLDACQPAGPRPLRKAGANAGVAEAVGAGAGRCIRAVLDLGAAAASPLCNPAARVGLEAVNTLVGAVGGACVMLRGDERGAGVARAAGWGQAVWDGGGAGGCAVEPLVMGGRGEGGGEDLAVAAGTGEERWGEAQVGAGAARVGPRQGRTVLPAVTAADLQE